MEISKDLVDSLKWVFSVLLAPLLVWIWRKHEKDHDNIDADRKELWRATRQLEEAMATSSSKLNNRIMTHIDEQISDIKVLVRDEDNKLAAEQSLQRGHIGKIFDKIEAHAQRSEDRHVETLSAIHSLATTMHQALATKADK